MPPGSGSLLTLDVEKPAAGGRMLGRHDGQVVLVWGAIPGERVIARVDRVGKGVLYAETVEVVRPSADRRLVGADWRCGGNVLAHVKYARQLQLKSDIIRDAFLRIGRMPLPAAPEVRGSPEQGYRMRARLHVSEGRLGFLREGTHQMCEAAPTGQLLPSTLAWIADVERLVQRRGLAGGLAGVEIAENIEGNQRACHLDLHAGTDAAAFAPLADGLVGLSAQRVDRPPVEHLAGTPVIHEVVHRREADPASALRLQHHVRAFFQANRYLLEDLIRQVSARVASGPVVDLYAGVGLFGLALAAAGSDDVTLVEGDPVSGADLHANAEPFGGRVHVIRQSVETFLAAPRQAAPRAAGATVIADPPRTGMTKAAVSGIVRQSPLRIVYVSCDVATLARDARALAESGYALEGLIGMDLFPNTAHVETISVFTRDD